MRLILDTHIMLWAFAEPHRLRTQARDLLLDPANEKLVSIVSLWEVAIKNAARRHGPEPLPFDAAQTLQLVNEAGFRLVSVTADHVLALETLPHGRHRDPFDRMLVAQAMAERSTLLTRDAALGGYGDHVLVV